MALSSLLSKKSYFCFSKLAFYMILTTLLGIMGPWQIVLIVLVVLLLFGGKKIPQLMKGLGEGMKEFKNASKDLKEDNKEEK